MDAFSERAVGQFPLSIATSLALESVCGIHPEHSFNVAPLREHKEFWINVKTLFRNLLGSMEKSAAAAAMPTRIAETMLEEMETIKSIVSDYSGNSCKVVYYLSNYEGLEKKYPKAVPRMDSTPGQKMATATYTKTVEAINKIHPDHGIELFKLKLEPQHRPNALILTHIPYDLCSEKAFGTMTLIESHTGAVKEKGQWYTKYLNGSELSRMPFREDLLQVFGDKETFRPMDNKLRKELIELAEKYRWTALTTRDKIFYSLGQMSNPYASSLIKSILV